MNTTKSSALIISLISQNLLSLVCSKDGTENYSNPFKQWKRINSHFAPHNEATCLELKIAFFQMSLELNEQPMRFIGRIDELASNLNILIHESNNAWKMSVENGKIVDDDKLAILIHAIKPRFPVNFAVLSKDVVIRGIGEIMSGMMAAAVGVGEVMRRSREDEVSWVREEEGRARLRHWG
jgi:hypothetical protein